MNGLDLWNKLELTDERFTKRFDKGSFRGTAVDAIYNIKRVTEQLGPVGFAWGWHIVKDELVKFEAGDVGSQSEPTWVHNCVVRAWFRQDDGSIREVEHVGSTIAARFVGRGPNRRFMVDDEYAKKSVTDALSKIMVSLGASADIWLGRFDGNKYVPPVNGDRTASDSDAARSFDGEAESLFSGPQAGPGGDAFSRAAESDAFRPDGLPAPRTRTVEDNGLLAEARGHLLAVRGMDGAGLRETRNWLRLSPDGRQPSRWTQLGALDRELRDELAAAMNRRAAELGISLKEAA